MILTKSNQVVVREEESHYILFCPENDKLVVLNETAYVIWKNYEGLNYDVLLDNIREQLSETHARETRRLIDELILNKFIFVE